MVPTGSHRFPQAYATVASSEHQHVSTSVTCPRLQQGRSKGRVLLCHPFHTVARWVLSAVERAANGGPQPQQGPCGLMTGALPMTVPDSVTHKLYHM